EAAFKYSTVARHTKILAPTRRSPFADCARSPRGQGCYSLTNDAPCSSVFCLRLVSLPAMRVRQRATDSEPGSTTLLWRTRSTSHAYLQYFLNNALVVCRAWVLWSHSHLARGTLLPGIIASLSPLYARFKSVRKRESRIHPAAGHHECPGDDARGRSIQVRSVSLGCRASYLNITIIRRAYRRDVAKSL
ncbi:hypothetical protein EV714DRAFT_222465, partial [Schizophyllum commune]